MTWILEKLLDSINIFVRMLREKQLFITHSISSGGSSQMIPWQEDVVLDASDSKDPNEVSSLSTARSLVEFEWVCHYLVGVEQRNCFGYEGSVDYVGPIWTIPKRSLLEGVEYMFTVSVTNKAKGREASTKQTVLLVDKEIPVVTIT
jgi:REJ domain.